MTTTHDVILSAIPAYQLLREAEIDLRGYDVILRINQSIASNTGVDDYGDIVNQSNFLDTPIKVLFDKSLANYYHGVITYTGNNATTNESTVTPIIGMVKLQQKINVGDRIKFEHGVYQMLENKEFQVSSVQNIIHYKPIAKKIVLVPMRDN